LLTSVLHSPALGDKLEFADIAVHGTFGTLRFMLVSTVVFYLIMLGLVKSNGHKVIGALEIREIDEASKGVDGILINVSCEI
jgi:hypothetical protein